MNISKILKAVAAAIALMAGASSASATTIEFVPPNDTSGTVFTNNTNDGWSAGRGIGFNVTSETTINSIGVFQNLTNVALSYGIYEISASTGVFSRTSTLRSGGDTVSTSGLEWIDFGFADLILTPGNNYLLEFAFSAASNQNFFYNNNNVAWNQGGFTFLDGTRADSFSNSVVAAFRVNELGALAPVPVPAGGVLLFTGLGALIVWRRKSKRSVDA